MVAHQVGARRRDERDEALQQLPGLEQEGGGAVAPAVPKSVEQAAVVEPLEPRG